jgi:hypothetical protein
MVLEYYHKIYMVLNHHLTTHSKCLEILFLSLR